MSGMRCISLWQPWASAMMVPRELEAGMIKRIETRGWAPDKSAIGQRMAIAAAKTQKDMDTKEPLRDWWMENVKRKGGYRACFEKAGLTDWERLPFGAVLGHGLLVDVVPTEELLPTLAADWIEKDWGNYRPGRFGWVFADMVVLPAPVPVVGRQGIFWWEEKAA